MKERPERKVIFEITGDGLTAEEVGRIRQVIRHLNYKRGRSRTGAGSTGKRTAGSNRGKYSGSSRGNNPDSGRGNRLQRVERRMKHGSGRNYLFYRGSSRRHGWPFSLRRTPCEPE